MHTETLTALANRYGSDKGTKIIGKYKGAHNFTDIYQSYLSEYKDAPMNILEIGLGADGASLKMWHDFFKNSIIYGLDIRDFSYLNTARIKTSLLDQSNPEMTKKYIKELGNIDFDVIIDDGSHRPYDQQLSLDLFFTKLKSEGFYFIEDLLSNGIGDGFKGNMASQNVRNTRRVLKHYQKFGEFERPHAFKDVMYLTNNIEYINFHAPRVSVKYKLQLKFIYPLKKIIYYKKNSENLCLIRKK